MDALRPKCHRRDQTGPGRKAARGDDRQPDRADHLLHQHKRRDCAMDMATGPDPLHDQHIRTRRLGGKRSLERADLMQNQEEGQKLLEHLVRHAASADVQMETQVRIAANIANATL